MRCISSARYDAKHFAELIHGHWIIENNLHWQLDIQFSEDALQIHKDHNPENLSVLRKISKQFRWHLALRQASA